MTPRVSLFIFPLSALLIIYGLTIPFPKGYTYRPTRRYIDYINKPCNLIQSSSELLGMNFQGNSSNGPRNTAENTHPC